MSKLFKLPSAIPSYSANFKQNSTPPGIAIIRASERLNVHRQLQVIKSNMPTLADGVLLSGGLTNQFIYSRLDSDQSFGMLHNSYIGAAVNSIKTLDGKNARALRRSATNNGLPHSFVASSQTITLNSRMCFGALIRFADRFMFSAHAYLRWIVKSPAGTEYLNTIIIQPDGSFDSESYPDFDIGCTVEKKENNWLWVNICINTPADKAVVNAMVEIGFLLNSPISPEIGGVNNDEDLLYIDAVQVARTSLPDLPLSTNGSQAVGSADVLHIPASIQDNMLLSFKHDKAPRGRQLVVNGAVIGVSAGDNTTSLYFKNNLMKVYGNGDEKFVLPFSPAASIELSSHDSIVLESMRVTSGDFTEKNIIDLTFTFQGIAGAISKALNGEKLIVAQGVAKDALAILAQASGLAIFSGGFEVTYGGTLYLEMGIETVFRIKSKENITSYRGEVDVCIVGKVINNVEYWAVSLAAGQALGSKIARPILRISGIHQAGYNNPSFNSYHYDYINDQASVTVDTGDKLVYEIYLPVEGTVSALDCVVVGGFDPSFRHYGTYTTDQNGVTPHPAGDVSMFALRKWYRREFDLTKMKGLVLREWAIALEAEANALTAAYYRNVVVYDAAGNIKCNIFTDTLVNPDPKTWTNGGSVNYHTIQKSNLTPSEAVGIVPLL